MHTSSIVTNGRVCIVISCCYFISDFFCVDSLSETSINEIVSANSALYLLCLLSKIKISFLLKGEEKLSEGKKIQNINFYKQETTKMLNPNQPKNSHCKLFRCQDSARSFICKHQQLSSHRHLKPNKLITRVNSLTIILFKTDRSHFQQSQ